MTVPVQTPVTSSVANGVTTVFPFNFKIVDEDDLTVTVDGVVVTTGFTITGVGEDSGGDVTFDVAPANGLKVVRYLNPVLSRVVDYQQFGDWLAPIVNGDFDRIWLTLQSLYQALARSIKLPVDVIAGQDITEDAAGRANKVITFDVDGNVALKAGTELIPEVDQAVTNALNAAADAQAAASAADSSADIAAAAADAAVNTPVAAPTHAASSKSTPADTDEIPLIDSAASYGLKRLTWANLKAALKTYFDTLYNKVTVITSSSDPSFADSSTNASSTNWVIGYFQAKAFGISQTWQDLTASRVASTIYQNTSGKPIGIAISASAGAQRDIEVSANGSTGWIRVGVIPTSALVGNQFTVPNNWYYRINGSVSAGYTWSELRA